MEFRILGPLEVRGDGDGFAGRRRPRALLAVLLLHANEVVPADQLIEELWGADSPERAAAALRFNVSRLRKAIPPDVLATRSPGYVLHVRPDELDLHRFERLVDEGRTPRPRPRGRCVGTAPRCAVAVAGPAARRLRRRELRPGRPSRGSRRSGWRRSSCAWTPTSRSAVTTKWSAAQALVAEHPLRERPGRLMTALYRSGRQAEALDAYQDARRSLVDELGIEPSQALQELERAILRQDRALDRAGAGAVSVRGGRGAVGSGRGDRRGAVAALLAVAEPLVRRPPRVLILAGIVTDAAELRARRPGSRRTGLQSRRAGSSSGRHRSRRRRLAPTWRGWRPSSMSSCCSPTLPTDSWPTELPTSSWPPLLASALRRGASRSPGHDADRVRCWCPSVGRKRLVGGRARRVAGPCGGRAAPSGRHRRRTGSRPA